MTASESNAEIVTDTAFAKVNLALHVRARRADGYHEIESLFAFCEDGDVLACDAAESLSLEIAGPFGTELVADESNLVMRAARALQTHFGMRAGATIRLEKRLPVAAGLGGGSADAAAAARMLARLWGLDADTAQLADAIGFLGADVPVCIASQTAIGRGVGEVLGPWAGASGLTGVPILLVNPLKPCPTGSVYKGWDQVDRGALRDDVAQWRNDLEPSALALVPEIADVLAVLQQQPDVTMARMSGSGATCFALFAETAARDAAQARIGGAHENWWTMASRLR